MSLLLSLDLGLSTGWAILNYDGTVERYGVVYRDKVIDVMRTIKSGYLIDCVVAEKPQYHRGHLGEELETIVNSVARALTGLVIYYVGPGEWKPHPIAKTPLPGITTPHERDAIRLGMFFAKTRLQGQA